MIDVFPIAIAIAIAIAIFPCYLLFVIYIK